MGGNYWQIECRFRLRVRRSLESQESPEWEPEGCDAVPGVYVNTDLRHYLHVMASHQQG
jgi:hypothetical protein